MPDEEHKLNESGQGRHSLSLKFLLFVLVAAALGTVALAGWKEAFSKYLETEAPLISVVDMPRGIGLTPVSMKFELRDGGAGLDEVVVRTHQKGITKEILRRRLHGQFSALVNIEFPGARSDLEEGIADIDVKAFDRSFWSNSGQKIFPIKIDYRRPKLEVLTSQHNARHGGSQLIFYRAIDEDLALSGVKVGGETFLGYPARGLDREFEDPSLFVAIYALDLRVPASSVAPHLFAEDRVGNAAALSFYNKVHPRAPRPVTLTLSEGFVGEVVPRLAEESMPRLRDLSRQGGEDLEFKTPRGTDERLVEEFDMVNKNLRRLNDYEVMALLKGPRFEAYWKQAFLMPAGGVQLAFGDKLTFMWGGRSLGQTLLSGYEISAAGFGREVLAANDGIVVFSENLGVYGRMVGIDHGLGLVSLYGHLEQAFVHKGEVVTRGQRIAKAGNTGFSRGTNLYYEMRVHGIPVDPVEWWDEGWFYAHVTSKINDVKRVLGIPVYKPLP